MELIDIEGIRRLLAAERRTVTVEEVPDGRPDWVVRHGRLLHIAADYFSIHAIVDGAGVRALLLRQTEDVIVALLVARHRDEMALLLAVRSEPGLVGTTCLSTTIQSTFANYSRRHGGRATPFLDVVTTTGRDRIVHESVQFDWGDHYDGKVKRFLVIEVAPDLEVPNGFAWVSVDTARALLVADHLITNDLRALLGVTIEHLARGLGAEDAGSPVARTRTMPTPAGAGWIGPSIDAADRVDLDALRVVRYGRTQYVDDAGAVVGFHRTTAASREVTSWVQPLLRLPGRRRITLYQEPGPDGRVALVSTAQRGVPGLELWAPAGPDSPPASPGSLPAGHVIRCRTSGEGGRFLHHRIDVALAAADEAVVMDSARWPDGTRWMTRDEVQSLVTSSLATSLELRLAWSLLAASRHA